MKSRAINMEDSARAWEIFLKWVETSTAEDMDKNTQGGNPWIVKPMSEEVRMQRLAYAQGGAYCGGYSDDDSEALMRAYGSLF